MTLKHLVVMLFLTVLLGFSLQSQTVPQAPPVSSGPKKVFVIPIQQDIDESIIYVVRRGIKEAIEQKADIVILEMDTYGGSIFVTDEIFKILNKFPHQDALYTYVNTRAGSAGSFIAAATHQIYMAPGSVIGAAAPVNADGSDINKTMDLKIKSFVRGIVRAQAERQGHRADVFESMVDSDRGLTIDGAEIVGKGNLLTLTSDEAAKEYGTPKKTLLSSGTMVNLESVIEKIAGSKVSVSKVEPSGLETLAKWIVAVSPFLLSAAMICGYIEFKTPGFGFFGITAIVCALLYFFGHFVAGLSGFENALFFMIGVGLITVELFLFPGFILPGVVGLGMVLFSLIRATIDLYPHDGFLPTMPAWEGALAQFGLSLFISFLGILLVVRFLPKTALYHRMVLPTAHNPLPLSLSLSPLIGNRGTSLTPLRPSGTVRFGEDPVDVVTQGDFIEAGQTVEVIRVEGSRVVVTAV